MNTKIELEYEGKTYTLEYNRAGIKVLEAKGFDVEKFLAKPLTNIELVFQGAFVKNHPQTQLSTIEAILDGCPDKGSLIATLTNMVTECYESLLSEPNGDDSKKVTWKTVDLSPKKEKISE